MQSRLLEYFLSRFEPRAVPIITRLIKRNRWPSLPIALAISLIVAVLCIAGWLWVMLSEYHTVQQSIAGSIFILTAIWSVILFIAMPSGMGSMAARIAGRDIRSEEFALLRLTHLTAHDLIQGYFGVTLFRNRLMLAVVTGVMPNVIGSYLIFVNLNPANNPYLLIHVVTLTLSMIGFWELFFVGSIVGIVSALALHSERIAAMLTSLGFFVVSLIMMAAIMISQLSDRPLVFLLGGVVALLVPYALLRSLLHSKWGWLDRRMRYRPKFSLEL